MSYQPPTAPMGTGSSPAQKPKKKRGCLGCGLLIIGLIVALFIGSAVIAGIVEVVNPSEDPDPAPTATVSVTPESTTAAPEPTSTPSPEPTTVPPPPPPPEPEPVEPEPEPEVPAPEPEAPPQMPEIVPAPDPVAPPAVVPYPNCQAVRDANAAPIRPGDPGWNPELDADGDGQACGNDR